MSKSEKITPLDVLKAHRMTYYIWQRRRELTPFEQKEYDSIILDAFNHSVKNHAYKDNLEIFKGDVEKVNLEEYDFINPKKVNLESIYFNNNLAEWTLIEKYLEDYRNK